MLDAGDFASARIIEANGTARAALTALRQYTVALTGTYDVEFPSLRAEKSDTQSSSNLSY